MAQAFIDEHPDRYQAIGDGDYVVTTFLDGTKHFVEVSFPGGRGPGLMDQAACGAKTPNWRDFETSRKMPMGGIVNCESCLDRYEESKNG